MHCGRVRASSLHLTEMNVDNGISRANKTEKIFNASEMGEFHVFVITNACKCVYVWMYVCVCAMLL